MQLEQNMEIVDVKENKVEGTNTSNNCVTKYHFDTFVNRRYNRYNDVELDLTNLPSNKICSEEDLKHFLIMEEEKWLKRMQNYTTDSKKRDAAIMWLKLPPILYNHLSMLLDWGSFVIHHGVPEYLMLIRHNTKRQEDKEVKNAPLYSTHYAKIECLVVDRDSVTGKIHYLAVREAYASGTDRTTFYKLITGLILPGERIDEAAEREVWEETKIKAQFVGVIGISNRINTRFSKDEYIFGCVLHTTIPNQQPIIDDSELMEAHWIEQTQKDHCNNPSKKWIRAAGIAGTCNLLKREDSVDVRGRPYVLSTFTFQR